MVAYIISKNTHSMVVWSYQLKFVIVLNIGKVEQLRFEGEFCFLICKTWLSLFHCGYNMHLENSSKTFHIFLGPFLGLMYNEIRQNYCLWYTNGNCLVRNVHCTMLWLHINKKSILLCWIVLSKTNYSLPVELLIKCTLFKHPKRCITI